MRSAAFAWLGGCRRVAAGIALGLLLLGQGLRATPSFVRLGRGLLGDVDLDPAGRWVAVATSLGVELLDRDTLTLVRTLQPQGEPASSSCVVFSPDGALVAAQVWGLGTCVWRVETGQLVWVLAAGPGAWVRPHRPKSLAFIPGRPWLVSTSPQGDLLVWNLDSGELVRKVKTFLPDLFSVAASPDGRWLALTTPSSVLIYDTHSWQLAQGWEWRGGEDRWGEYRLPVAFDPDSRRVAASGSRATYVWELGTGREVLRLDHPAEVVLFSADGRSLLLARWKLETFDLQSGKLLRTVTFRGLNVLGAARSADGRWLALGTKEGWLGVVDLATHRVAIEQEIYSSQVHSVAVSGESSLLAVGYFNREARLFSADGQLLHRLLGFGWGVFSVAFSPDGTLIATGSGDQSVTVWATRTGQRIWTIRGFDFPVWNALFSPDGQYLVAGTDRLYAWRVGDWHRPPVAELPGSRVFAVPVGASPDGKLVVPRPEGLTLVEFGTWEEVATIRLPAAPAARAWHPAGRLIALAPEVGWVGTVVIWDTASQTEIARFRAGGGSINAMAFSPQGGLLAVGSADQLILIRTESWEVVGRYRLHSDWIESIAFFPAGDRVVTGSADGTVVILDVAHLLVEKGG